MDFAGVNFTGAFSSLTDDWSVGALSIPGWVWLAALGAAAVVGAVAGLLMSRRTGGAERDGHTYTTLEGESRREVVTAYRKMVKLLARKGLPPRTPAQTPQDYAGIVAPRLVRGVDTVRWLTEAANIAAYDSSPLSPSLVREARDRMAALRLDLAVRTG